MSAFAVSLPFWYVRSILLCHLLLSICRRARSEARRAKDEAEALKQEAAELRERADHLLKNLRAAEDDVSIALPCLYSECLSLTA